jgi:hypothetical protein
MLRRLAIACFFLLTILMGALGWILGRPGVFRPDSQTLAAPVGGTAGMQSSHGGAPAMSMHGHGDAQGE